MAIDLDGKVAVVTGAGRGLGRAYALDLGRRGAAVLVNDLPGSDGAAEVVAEIEQGGGTASASYNDVSTRAGGRAIAEDAVQLLGGLDILVNNAGVLSNGYFEDLTDQQLDRIFDIHLKGTFFVSQSAFGVMRGQRYGRIVNISSNTAFGMIGLSSYAAAKAGIVGLTRTMALEGAAHGILVNAVMPNAATPIMVDDPIPGFEENERFVRAFAGVSDRFEPELVAPLVTYLSSSECSLSGEVLSSLGGRYARVFYGVTEGWLSSPGEAVDAEQIAEHLDEIVRIGDDFLVPAEITDEFEAVARLLSV